MIQSVTRKGPALRAGLCLGVCGRLLRLRGGATLALQVGWSVVITRRGRCAAHQAAPGGMCSIGVVVLLPRMRRPLQQRRDADASSMLCAASWLQCSTVVSKLVVACCHVGGHRTAVHAGAARHMDADGVSHAPAGGGTPPVYAAGLSMYSSEPAGKAHRCACR